MLIRTGYSLTVYIITPGKLSPPFPAFLNNGRGNFASCLAQLGCPRKWGSHFLRYKLPSHKPFINQMNPFGVWMVKPVTHSILGSRVTYKGFPVMLQAEPGRMIGILFLFRQARKNIERGKVMGVSSLNCIQ